MSKPLKVYQLYPRGRSFSDRSADYRGALVDVMATSALDARRFAASGRWADFEDERPLGVLQEAGRDGHHLACGCIIQQPPGFTHGQGIRAVRECIASHRPTCRAQGAGANLVETLGVKP